jgi:hypothetical protein
MSDGERPRLSDIALDGCHFYDLSKQANTGFRYAESCPTRRYARKNIGYLLAIQQGAELIVETDDDNSPLPVFWAERRRFHTAPALTSGG